MALTARLGACLAVTALLLATAVLGRSGKKDVVVKVQLGRPTPMTPAVSALCSDSHIPASALHPRARHRVAHIGLFVREKKGRPQAAVRGGAGGNESLAIRSTAHPPLSALQAFDLAQYSNSNDRSGPRSGTTSRSRAMPPSRQAVTSAVPTWKTRSMGCAFR